MTVTGGVVTTEGTVTEGTVTVGTDTEGTDTEGTESSGDAWLASGSVAAAANTPDETAAARTNALRRVERERLRTARWASPFRGLPRLPGIAQIIARRSPG